ncbi:MAG TPA: tetratricopeptide repeat protein [Kofleriaceae bacterium]|jgi:tetratricopeptide (TPR) repeat protein|nr:tetratricopeptide repeat protein [Kofleriaceae bacterium]
MTRWFAPLVLGGAVLVLSAPGALADPPATAPASSPASPPAGSPVREAAKHFHRGVALYSEADYRGALTEFKRAYEIAPNAGVLYNVGETHYQLQNYAAALAVFERYLTEAGATAPHRREVEQTIDTLRTRVGKVRITASADGCEVTVDDELVGKAPFDSPVTVSVGRRKITAMAPGRSPDTRFVEVAAGDTVDVALSLAPIGPPSDTPPIAPEAPPDGVDYARIGWFTTGALAVGTAALGTWAYVASHQLQDARHTYPTTRAELDSKASRATTIGVIADVVGVATVVAGAVTLKLTLSRSREHEVHVGVVPGGVQIAGVFR